MLKKAIVCLITLCLTPAIYSEPPQINVTKDGTTVIKSGANVVTVLPDGTLKVQSPVLNLTIGGDIPGPVVPPTPPVVPVVSDFQKLYDQDSSDPDAKKATLALLVRIWTSAVEKVNEAGNSQEINDLVSPQLKQLGKPLASIRNAIADDLKKSFPEPVDLTPEKKRVLTEKLEGIVTKLQGVK